MTTDVLVDKQYTLEGHTVPDGAMEMGKKYNVG